MAPMISSISSFLPLLLLLPLFLAGAALPNQPPLEPFARPQRRLAAATTTATSTNRTATATNTTNTTGSLLLGTECSKVDGHALSDLPSFSAVHNVTDSRLTLANMTAGFLRHNATHRAAPPGFRKLLARLLLLQQCKDLSQQQQPLQQEAALEVHVALLGGSFALGAGAAPKGTRDHIKWFARVMQWLRAAFPAVAFRTHDFSAGSTTMLLGARYLQDYEGPMDLVFLDYSQNDGALNDIAIAYATELCVRRSVQLGAAVVVLAENMHDFHVEAVYERVAALYDVPVLSYYQAVRLDPQVSGGGGGGGGAPGFSEFWQAPLHYPHPNARVHMYVAEFVAAFLLQRLRIVLHTHTHKPAPTHGPVSNSNSNSNSNAASVLLQQLLMSPDPPPLDRFGGPHFATREADSLESCAPAVAEFSSLTDLTGTGTHTPHAIAGSAATTTETTSTSNSGAKTAAVSSSSSNTTSVMEPFFDASDPSHVHKGWEYAQDAPGKPFGWISRSATPSSTSTSTSTTTGSDGQPVALSFTGWFVSGKVTITYLSTYENAGVVELYLGINSFDSNGGMFPSRSANVTGCCNASKAAHWPLLPRTPVSNSVWIDTWNGGAPRTSEIKMKTFQFSFFGRFILTLSHLPLGPGDVKRRGGEKVKILGIRTC